MTLLDALNNKKIFKLVLGLGNQDHENIKHLVEIYCEAGADMFDINPSKEAVKTVFDTIKNSGKNIEDFYYSISTGVEGDVHTQKCSINPQKCKACGKCAKKCPQDAIVFENKYPKVVTEKCIGCRKCDDCKAIKFNNHNAEIESIVKIANDYKLDCIELHLSTKKIPDEEIKYIIKEFNGVLSLCMDRKHYSNERIKKLINKVIKWNKSANFIIQADGVPMSGGDNSFVSTLQAVSMAHIVQPYGTFILMSGGTNEKTAELAKMCSLRYNGISVGSYARKIIKDKPKNEAITAAKKLIEACKK